MATSPTTPTQAGYISFLYGVVGIPAKNLPTASGVATGGSMTALIDAAANWASQPWLTLTTYVCLDSTSGLIGQIASSTSDTLTFAEPLATPVNASDPYQIMPAIVQDSLTIALEIVNEALCHASTRIYTLAVYNLAADRLINFANDSEILANQTYFSDLREKKYKLSSFAPGVVASSSDEATATSLLNPEQMKNLTIMDLQTLKTPYGRQYMAFAQMWGQGIWGLT